MKLIDKLYEKAKSRPRPKILGTVFPEGDKWTFSLKEGSKGTSETKCFDRKRDAVDYANTRMNGKGTLYTVSFINASREEGPFTPVEKQEADQCG